MFVKLGGNGSLNQLLIVFGVIMLLAMFGKVEKRWFSSKN